MGKLNVLVDKSASGKVRPWKEKKENNLLLSIAYEDVNEKKAFRLKDCADWLEYQLYTDGSKKLTNANFCRVRLCPICSWRRGLKIFSQTSLIMNKLQQVKSSDSVNKYAYLFLTLTARNCTGDKLNKHLNDFFSAWNNFSRLKDFKSSVVGWFRALEVTHNVNPFITWEMWQHSSERYKTLGLNIGDANPDYDTFHPHFHCILVVDYKDYFENRNYITQERFTEMWKKSMKLKYTPVVDVRRVRTNTRKGVAKAVAEVAKYAVKDGDYIVPHDWDLTVDTVRTLDDALDRRRLVAYGGIMKKIHNELNLDDGVDGDLLHVDAEEQETGEEDNKIYYSWNVGYSQYIKCE